MIVREILKELKKDSVAYSSRGEEEDVDPTLKALNLGIFLGLSSILLSPSDFSVFYVFYICKE